MKQSTKQRQYSADKRAKPERAYKSKLERDFAKHIESRGLKAGYEQNTFKYERPSHYTPDWKINEGLFLETKGEFAPAQRANMVAFRNQHPNVEIVMVFADAQNLLHKKAKMTYAEWSIKNGFRFHDLQAVYNKKKKGYDIRNPIPKEFFTSN